MINLFAIYFMLLFSLLGGCALWFIIGLVLRWKAELTLPLVIAGTGAIILSFVYLLAQIAYDQLVLHIT